MLNRRTAGVGLGVTALVLLLGCVAPEETIEVGLGCAPIDGNVELERYVAVGDRSTPLPIVGSDEYAMAIPPRCEPVLPEGIEVSSISVSIGDEPVRIMQDQQNNRFFTLPFRPPGMHTVSIEVMTQDGTRGSSEQAFNWIWRDDSINTTARAIDGGIAGINFFINYEAPRLSLTPEFDNTDAAEQEYEVVWDFGDGSSQNEMVDQRDGMLSARHSYDELGTYSVSVTVTGLVYGDSATANLEVTLQEGGGFTVRNFEFENLAWVLLDVNDTDAIQQSSENDPFGSAEFGIEVIETVGAIREEDQNGRQFAITRNARTGDNGDYLLSNFLTIMQLPERQITDQTAMVTVTGNSSLGLHRMNALNQPPVDKLLISFPNSPQIEQQEFELQPGEMFEESAGITFPIPGSVEEIFEIRACLVSVQDEGVMNASVVTSESLCSSWRYELGD